MDIRTTTPPKALRALPHPPAMLRITGSLPDPETHIYVSIMGTVHPSRYGTQILETLIKALSETPVTLVTGLDHGTSVLVHKEAQAAGLTSIAVLAHGIDAIAHHHRELAHTVLDTGGALISEYEDTIQASLATYPARNRLIAGLSPYTLIPEARHTDGSLAAAYLALEYHKTVLAVPHNIFSATAYGPLHLIRRGAVPVTHGNILRQELGLSIHEPQIPGLSPVESHIMAYLKEPRTDEELALDLSMTQDDLRSGLHTLEMKGYIGMDAGRYHRLI